MKYYSNTKLKGLTFKEAIEKVTDSLQDEGFGVLTVIDVKETLKENLDVDFKPYHILGACNPPSAYKALQSEDYIGLMLPCNVIVKQEHGYIDVAVIDPKASMKAVKNEFLGELAQEIWYRLNKVIISLQGKS